MREKTPRVWELRVYLGRDDRGRVKHQSGTFRGGKREAQRALAHLVADCERQRLCGRAEAAGASVPYWSPETTVNDAIAAWRDNGWDDLSPTTTERYEQIWRTYIADRIGPRKIVTIGPYEVEQFFRELKSHGVGLRTMQQLRVILHRSCRLARKWSGNQLPNPVADTDLPGWSFRRVLDEVLRQSRDRLH
jgi:hypothetical protein